MKQGNMLSTAAWAVLFCGLLFSPLTAAEVYRWTDENGVTHFSQTPPPAGQEAEVEEVPDPATGAAAQQAAGIDFDGAQTDLEESPAAGGEMSAAERRRQELAEKANQRRAQQEALEAGCAQARARLAQIEPSRRVYYENEEGETVRMDDEARVAEVEQLHNFISRNCP